MDFKEFVETHTIGEIKKAYPQIKDYWIIQVYGICQII